jgi:DNA-directed RNA polymerase specialized sigma24 family protein
MSRRKRKHRRSGAGRLIRGTILLLAALAALIWLWQNTFRPQIAKTVVNKVVEESLKSAGEQNPQVRQAIENLSPEDREAVTEIVENNLTPEKIADVNAYVQSGDYDGLRRYAQQNLTPEEYLTLERIYENYAGNP